MCTHTFVLLLSARALVSLLAKFPNNDCFNKTFHIQCYNGVWCRPARETSRDESIENQKIAEISRFVFIFLAARDGGGCLKALVSPEFSGSVGVRMRLSKM